MDMQVRAMAIQRVEHLTKHHRNALLPPQPLPYYLAPQLAIPTTRLVPQLAIPTTRLVPPQPALPATIVVSLLRMYVVQT